MARRAKSQVTTAPQTPAEIPAEEQPYPIPANWRWVILDSVADIITGSTPSKQKLAYYGEKIPFFKPADLDADRHVKKPTEYLSELGATVARLVPAGSTAVCCIGTIGKSGYLDVAGSTNQQINVIVSSGCNKLFIYYYSKTNLFIDQLFEKSSATTISIVNKTKMGECLFPLPPLAEQKRIVERIENLFGRLDKAKEKLEAALASFPLRRAAILHKAFTGELTAQWRAKHGHSLDDWEEKTLQQVCKSKITDGTHKTPIYSDKITGIPFLSSKDITSMKINWDNIMYIIPSLHEELYKRLSPQKDDVLLAKNGTTGVAAIVDTDAIFDIYVTLALLRPDKTIVMPRYLFLIINSQFCKTQFDSHLTGIGLPNLHLRDIKEVVIPVPHLPEQAEIVRQLDALLAREEQAKAAAEKALASIDMMKKSILARAFRGELGTNDPVECTMR